jgi:peptidoglycan/xylan/chitin deacetylase (PgdA/CDA1 family)
MFSNEIEQVRGYLSGWRRNLIRRRGVRVFRYHGLVEARADPVLDRNQHLLSVFRAQMAYLRRFRVLSVGELLEELGRPELGRVPSAMITFDDGFQNNLLAAEILSRWRLPFAIFVPSGEVGPDRAMWSVEVSLLMMRGKADQVEALGRPWPLKTREDRERSFRELRGRLKAIPSATRLEAMAQLRAQFPTGESDRLLAECPWLRMLTWEELSQLGDSGAEIGSHGRHHEIQHADQPAAVREEELGFSRSEIETRLGRPCRTFAYPNGNFVQTSPAEVGRAGYQLAFTTETGTLGAPADEIRFLLPRISASAWLGGFVRGFWWQERGEAVGAPSRDLRPSEA